QRKAPRDVSALIGVRDRWSRFGVIVDPSDQTAASQLGEDIGATTPGMAICDEPPVAILEGQRRAGAAMNGAAASPPVARSLSPAEPRGDFSRVHAQRLMAGCKEHTRSAAGRS